MGKWTSKLRSGELEQASGVLYDGENGYCCLGVRERMEGVLFTYDIDADEWVDDENLTKLPSTQRCNAWGLGRLTGDDKLKIDKYFEGTDMQDAATEFTGETIHNRATTLAKLNDEYFDFVHIADFIDYMGWDNTEQEVA